jgi:WD40 repeat protein
MRFPGLALCALLVTGSFVVADDGALIPRLELKIQASAIALSPDDKFMAVADDENLVRRLSRSDGQSVDGFGKLPVPVTALAFSPDGKLLAAAGVSGTRPGSFELRMWRLEDKQLVYEIREPNHRDDGDGAESFAFLRFSPNGKLLAHPARNRTVEVYDVDKQAVAHTFPRGLIPSAVSFDPESKTVALGTDTGKTHGGIHHVDLATGKGLPSRSLLYSGVLDMAFSPDASTLFGGHRNWLYRLDTKSGQYSNALPNDGRWIATALAFSPTADRVALLSGKELQLWDTKSGAMMAQSPLPNGRLAWSTDGRVLVTATSDGRVRVWDTP